MDASASPARRSSPPWGVLGMLVLVALVESFVAHHDDDFSDAGPANWQYSKEAVERSPRARRAEILCLGTSLVKYGIQARTVADRTGRSTWNVAMCSGGMATNYYLLRRALRAGVRPRTILVDCQDTPYVRDRGDKQADNVWLNQRVWPELLTTADCLDLAWHVRDAGFFASVMLARALPSYKDRFEVRLNVRAALRGEQAVSRYYVTVLRRNWFINWGTHVAQVLPEDTAALTTRDKPPAEFPRDQLARNKLTMEYTRRFLDLAAANRIRVFWLLLPLAPEKQAQRDRDGVTSYYTRLARWAQKQSSGLTVIDGFGTCYGSGLFTRDEIHLNRRGALTFSTDVGEAVRRCLDDPAHAPRWVRLPKYRDVEQRVIMEDIIGSHSYVLSNKDTVRR